MPSHARPRSPHLRRVALIAVLSVLVLVLVGFAVVRSGLLGRAETKASTTPSPSASTLAAPSPSADTPTPSPSATPSPTPTQPTAYPVGTFTVQTTSVTFVDPSRGTMARGARSATNERTLLTNVRYPTGGPATGPFPVVVFAEGFNISAEPYAPLLDDLASRGYVVAAPEFPMASTIYPGPASQADLDNEPGDVSFVLTQLLALADTSGPLHGLLDSRRCAVMGHSDGAAVAAVLGYDPTFRDRRFSAAVILSGQAGDITRTNLEDSPPLLVAHGTADEINPYPIGQELYAAVAPPHHLLTIAGGRHLQPFTSDPIRPSVSAVIAAFLDAHVQGLPGAAATLESAGNAPGLSLQSQ